MQLGGKIRKSRFREFFLTFSRVKKKSVQIIFYLSNNSKNHPIVLTISSLFQFFKKLLLFHAINGNKSKVSSLLGINPYFIKDYERASKFYNMKNCSYAIELIHHADLKSKGIIESSVSHQEILIDLINEIFNCQFFSSVSF